MDSVANIYESTEGWMPAARSTTAEMVVSRQAQEVQASIVIAKRFPRNEVESFNRIIRALPEKDFGRTGDVRIPAWRYKSDRPVHSPGRSYGSELGKS